MQIATHTPSLVRTPALSAPRRDETRAAEAPAAAATPSAQPSPAGLPDAMLQARLRGRPLERNASLASQQALAQYADIARRDESSARVELVGIDTYA